MMKISRSLCAALMVAVLLAAVSGCKKEGPMERTGREIDKAAEKTGDKVEGAAEKTGKGIDKAVEKTGEKVEQAGEKIKDSVK